MSQCAHRCDNGHLWWHSYLLCCICMNIALICMLHTNFSIFILHYPHHSCSLFAYKDWLLQVSNLFVYALLGQNVMWVPEQPAESVVYSYTFFKIIIIFYCGYLMVIFIVLYVESKVVLIVFLLLFIPFSYWFCLHFDNSGCLFRNFHIWNRLNFQIALQVLVFTWSLLYFITAAE